MDQRFALPGVDASTPLPEAAQALLMAKADPLFELEDAARSGEDMDAVHDMRVASRRLRETMRLLAPLYPQPEFDRFYRRVRKVTSALGPVRDADVFIDEFAQLLPDLGEGGRHAVAFFIGYRMGARESEVLRLGHKLSRLGLEGGKRELRRIAKSIADSPDRRNLADFAHASVAERAAVVFGALPSALVEANILQQHALRIDFKRLRYAVEVFAPVYGDDFDELHDTLTAFQDVLGELHDLHLFLDMLRETARIALADRAGVSQGDLAEVESLLERRAAREFEKFSELTAEHPAQSLLADLLLPLARRPEPPEPEADAEPEPGAEPEPEPHAGPEPEAVEEPDAGPEPDALVSAPEAPLARPVEWVAATAPAFAAPGPSAAEEPQAADDPDDESGQAPA